METSSTKQVLLSCQLQNVCLDIDLGVLNLISFAHSSCGPRNKFDYKGQISIDVVVAVVAGADERVDTHVVPEQKNWIRIEFVSKPQFCHHLFSH